VIHPVSRPSGAATVLPPVLPVRAPRRVRAGWLVAACLAAAGLAAHAGPVRAQAVPGADTAPRRSAVLEGVVRDTAGAPVRGARVQLGEAADGAAADGAAADSAVSDEGGRFRVVTRRLGTQPLVVRALGYAAAEQVVTMRSAERVSVTVTLTRLQQLSAVVVRASRARDRVLAGIAERQKVGLGFFRDSLHMQRFRGEPLLRALTPWLGLSVRGWCGSTARLRDRRGRSVAVVLNDRPDYRREVLDCSLDPGEIALAEYYSDRREAPYHRSWLIASAGFMEGEGPGGDAPTGGGVLVVYTRAYLADPERRRPRSLAEQLRDRAVARDSAATARPSAHDSVLAAAGDAPVLTGVVHDSLLGEAAGAPLAGARVVALRLDGSADDGSPARETTSDARGRFAFAALEPGRWRVQATHAGLDSAGLWDGALADLTVAVGAAPPPLALATPARATLVAAVCGGAPAEVPAPPGAAQRTVLLWGGVRDEATERPLAGAVVRAAWLTVGPGGRAAERSAEVATDAAGRWALCLHGPASELDGFTVRATAGRATAEGATGAVSLAVSARGVARLDLTVAAPTASVAPQPAP
jgi:hypothetical protein